jgi:hypothetical protein
LEERPKPRFLVGLFWLNGWGYSGFIGRADFADDYERLRRIYLNYFALAPKLSIQFDASRLRSASAGALPLRF